MMFVLKLFDAKGRNLFEDVQLPQPERDVVPTASGLGHHPSLACLRERATDGKPPFAHDHKRKGPHRQASPRHRHAKDVHRSAKVDCRTAGHRRRSQNLRPIFVAPDLQSRGGPTFGLPTATMTSTVFGRIRDTVVSSARQMMLGVRYAF